MLKRLLPILLSALLLLSGCAPGAQSVSSAPDEPEETVFGAQVLENNGESLLVLADEDAAVRSSSDRFSVSISKAALADGEGNPLAAGDFTPGSGVEVAFTGPIAESYPAQILDTVRVTLVRKGEAESGVELPNPMEAYETPDFTGAAGFAVTALPQVEDMTLEGCWLIGGRVAQLDYQLEMDTKLTFRVAVDTGEDISGVYKSDWEEDVTSDMDGVSVRHWASAGGPALITWSKDGYAFSLYFPHPRMGMAGGLAPTFVEGGELTPEQAPGQGTAENPAA